MENHPARTAVRAARGDGRGCGLADVVLGPTQGDLTVIESGVTPGQIVVTDGVDKLIKGSKVTVKISSRRVRRRQETTPAWAWPGIGLARQTMSRAVG